MHLKQIDSGMFVSGQITPGEVPELSAAGVMMIVNNRPDGEEPGQPTSEEMGTAARAAGIDYRHIPVARGFSQPQVAAMAEALASAGGGTLAFCRSGTRSTYLWALARASAGESSEELAAKAAVVGCDLSPILPLIRR